MKLSPIMIGTALSLAIITHPVYAEKNATVKKTTVEKTTVEKATVENGTANNAKLTTAEQSTLAAIATIDVNEILISEVALNKKNNSNVTDLAKMMVDQHSSNLNQILTMAGASHAKLPLSGGEAGKLATEAKNTMMTLGALQGDEFDKAYADAMVTGHEKALKLIDTKLMKTAKSEEMKNFMTETRSVVAEHLEHAKKVQEALKS